MVRRMLAPIDWSKVDRVVEFGPGTGRFTFAALAQMKPSARFLAIEPGESFIEHLRSASDDARLIVANGEAQNLRKIMHDHGFTNADLILSGLPFSTIPEDDAAKIIARSRASLGAQGIFAAYQMRRDIERSLRGHFEIVRKDFELWNIPPCHLYWAKPIAQKQGTERAGTA
jgi:phospholipid N-methyltransferase